MDNSIKREIVSSIVEETEKICNFWNNAHGWAPTEACELLDKSRLDWHLSLTKQLSRWIDSDDSDGSLILAWANLGALVEGVIKIALSVHIQDYINDPNKIIKKTKVQEPDGLALEKLRVFSNGKLWDGSEKWNKWILGIQQYRNAIHAFKDRDIGTFEIYYTELEIYLEFIEIIDRRLPYPD